MPQRRSDRQSTTSKSILFERRDLALRISPVHEQNEGNSGHNDLLILRDVTRERTAIRKMQRNEDLLSSLINNVSNAILPRASL